MHYPFEHAASYPPGFILTAADNLTTIAMDDFTRRHLQEYADHVAFDDEREGFLEYAEQALAEDPDLADYGWPSLFEEYRRHHDGRRTDVLDLWRSPPRIGHVMGMALTRCSSTTTGVP